MKTTPIYTFQKLSFLLLILLLSGCDKSSPEIIDYSPPANYQTLDIGLDKILGNGNFDVRVTPRSHGYVAEAKGKGIIPTGEYAGHHFQIELNATYSGIGFETLIEGAATVKIRGERFKSVTDTLLHSFCCGEGYLQMIDGLYVFTVFGQVNHSTASDPHHHLFAGLAFTGGEMHMNIANQSGTIVDPADPPHNPGIGLITDVDPIDIEVVQH
ncbi:MAG: hypothetical protein ABIQ11_07165 [Saprospiraceae bacterium]